MGEFQDRLKHAARTPEDIERDNMQRQAAEEVKKLNKMTEQACKRIEDELIKQASSGKASPSGGKMLVKTGFISVGSGSDGILDMKFKPLEYGGKSISWSITPFGTSLMENIVAAEKKNSITCDFKVYFKGRVTGGFFSKGLHDEEQYFDCDGGIHYVTFNRGLYGSALHVSASTMY